MVAIFTELGSAVIDEVMRDPVAAEVYLDSLAILEDLTHSAVPELEPSRFTRDAAERALDELTASARAGRLDMIAENIELNRASWMRVLSRVDTGINGQDDIAKYIHGARTYREFALAEAESASDSRRSTEQFYPSFAVKRSAARLVAAQFPTGFISEELGLRGPLLEAAVSEFRRPVTADSEQSSLSKYYPTPQELSPLFDPAGRSVFAHRSSNGTVYFLHSKTVMLRGGKEQRIYFFARDVRPADAVSRLPDGYSITENARNGFLTISKKSQRAG